MARRDWSKEELLQLATEVEEVGRILRLPLLTAAVARPWRNNGTRQQASV